MLRLFSKRLSAQNVVEVPEDTDEAIEFQPLLAQFQDFEDRLKKTSQLLVRHSNALAELVITSAEIQNLTLKDDDTAKKSKDQKEFTDIVSKFRTTAIAPIQALLASFPNLKHRIDHRRSAFATMQRYRAKVYELSSKMDHSARLQRNRLKFSAAQERFLQLNQEVRQEMAQILAQDIETLIQTPLLKLVSAQQQWAQSLHIASNQIKKSIHTSSTTLTQRGSVAKVTHDRTSTASNPLILSTQEVDPTSITNMSHFNTEMESSKISSSSLFQQSTQSNSSPKQPTNHITKQSITPTTTASSTTNSTPTTNHNNNNQPPQMVLALDKSRSLRPKQHFIPGTRTCELHKLVKDSMARGLDIQDTVYLPEGYVQEEWIAVHIIDFYNEISLLYGTITEFCTSKSCPQMSAGPCYTYLWAEPTPSCTPTPGTDKLNATNGNNNHDHNNNNNASAANGSSGPISLPANEYIENLMQWVDVQICNHQLSSFTSSSMMEMDNVKLQAMFRNIFKRLFRVYAHMYHSHLKEFATLHAESHLNFCFKRFMYFISHFQLVERKELNALKQLICTLVGPTKY